MPEEGLALEDTVVSLDDNEKVAFSRFARKMLRWIPEERRRQASS